MGEIINRVVDSGIKTINIESWKIEGERSVIDLGDHLYKGLVLRENEFRAYLKNTDWTSYQDHFVGIYCSLDAIIPNWAYMLLTSKLSGIAKKIVLGNKEELESQMIIDQIREMDLSEYENERVIIKGCSDEVISEKAYLELTVKLTPVVRSLMFGEPCSAVPVFKRE